MFAIAGSFLALGAITLAFCLRLIAQEFLAAQSSQRATLIFFLSTACIAMLNLVWGYKDAYNIITQSAVSATDYLWDHGGLGALILGALLGVFAGEYLLRTAGPPSNRTRTIATIMLLGTFSVGPVLWYLFVQDTDFMREAPALGEWLSQTMLAWVSVGLFICVRLLPEFSKHQLGTAVNLPEAAVVQDLQQRRNECDEPEHDGRSGLHPALAAAFIMGLLGCAVAKCRKAQ